MSKQKNLHSSDKGKDACQQLSGSDKHLGGQRGDGILLESLNKEEHNYQPFPSLRGDMVYGDVVAKHLESHEPDSQILKPSRKHHSAHSGLTMHFESQMRKILQILATCPPPSKEFHWVPDIDHFTLHYKNQYTGIIIYNSPEIGVYRILLKHHELISVPTLRQAQAICHTIAWVFKDSLNR